MRKRKLNEKFPFDLENLEYHFPLHLQPNRNSVGVCPLIAFFENYLSTPHVNGVLLDSINASESEFAWCFAQGLLKRMILLSDNLSSVGTSLVSKYLSSFDLSVL